MTETTFKALVLRQADKQTVARIETLSTADLPDGDVLVAVEYSGLNYKDGLAVTGKGKIVRQFPLVPGIDLASTVLDSVSPDYKPGDKEAGAYDSTRHPGAGAASGGGNSGRQGPGPGGDRSESLKLKQDVPDRLPIGRATRRLGTSCARDLPGYCPAAS